MGRTHDTTTSVRVRRRLLAVAAVIALAGCGGNDDSATETASVADDSAADESMDEGAMEEDAVEFTDDAEEESIPGRTPASGGADDIGNQADLSDRDIITSVELTMSTSDVRSTADDVRRLAESNGAAVFSSDVSIGDEQADGSVPGGGQIVIRVVPAQLDGLVSALDGAGTVTRLSQDSRDVTDQLVDLEIRIRQTETSIERLELLLGDAGALDDVFELERELTSRVIELEQLRASERNTENLVALATLTVQIDYRTPDAIDEIQTGDDGIGDAFSDGWGAFVGAVFAIGYALAVSAPFLVTALALAGLAWFVTRRIIARSESRREHGRPSTATRTASSGPTAPPPPIDAQRSQDHPAPDAMPGSTATLVRDDDEIDGIDGEARDGEVKDGDASPAE